MIGQESGDEVSEAAPASEELAAEESGAEASSEGEVEDGPRIEFDTKTLDLGEVPKGDKAHYTFTFKNRGLTDLVIEEAKPSCGCTVAEFTETVAPGESGTITATIDTERFRGPISKTVTVSSNDPVNSKVHLQAKATVKPFVDVLPSQHVFLRADRGESASKKVTLISYEDDVRLSLLRIEPSNELITVNPRPIEPGTVDEDGNPIEGDYELEVVLADTAPVGRVNATVDIITNSEKVEKVTLQVRGNVRGLVQVRPSRVFLGNLAEKIEEPIVKTVRVTARSGDNLKIEKIESSFTSITHQVKTVEEGKSYDVELTIQGELPVGVLDEVITIFTNDDAEKEIEVKVRGQIG